MNIYTTMKKGHGEYTFADVHTVNSLERRALLFECLLPNGVNWTRRPIHAFCWKKDAPKHNLNIHHVLGLLFTLCGCTKKK